MKRATGPKVGAPLLQRNVVGDDTHNVGLRPELFTETAPDSHLLLQFDNGCSLTTLRLIRHEEARNVWMTGEQ